MHSARSKFRQILEAQKSDDKKRRKFASIDEVENNKALLETEKCKVII